MAFKIDNWVAKKIQDEYSYEIDFIWAYANRDPIKSLTTKELVLRFIIISLVAAFVYLNLAVEGRDAANTPMALVLSIGFLVVFCLPIAVVVLAIFSYIHAKSRANEEEENLKNYVALYALSKKSLFIITQFENLEIPFKAIQSIDELDDSLKVVFNCEGKCEEVNLEKIDIANALKSYIMSLVKKS